MTTPSARIVAAAMEALEICDDDGRVLVIRRMTALDRLRLFKAVGPTLCQNTAYLGMALLAVSVVSIDGVPVPAPVTEGQIEALVSRLGDSGIAAAACSLSRDAVPALESATLGN